jgi:hypothetical protein
MIYSRTGWCAVQVCRDTAEITDSYLGLTGEEKWDKLNVFRTITKHVHERCR